MRRLLVDAQVFLTPAFHRGMGKYSMELLSALDALNERQKQWDSVEILLSSQFNPEPEVFSEIKAHIAHAKIVKLDLKPDDIRNYHAVARHNRTAIDEYVAKGLKKQPQQQIDFMILSPMQGGICSVFPSNPAVQKSLICYDLIPFMFPEIYFRNPIAQTEYLSKLTELLRADRYLTISKTVANDLAVYLGIDTKRIANIDGGAIKHSSKRKELAVPRPFILMPTGNELRKNNRLGILGFAEFNKRHNNKYALVITSFFEPDQVRELSEIAPNIIFTGNISGQELNYLYEECDVLLFPSAYEGLGLPVLEAVEKGKPVACSDISVFREMSTTAFHYFDQKYGTSIANALHVAVQSQPDKAEYKAILQKYAWPATAKAAARALPKRAALGGQQRPQITIFGPNPECDTALAKVIQRSHAELSRVFDIDYCLEGGATGERPRANMLPFITRCAMLAPETAIPERAETTPVYYLTNDKTGAKALFTALAKPGVVILDTLDLTHAWANLRDERLIDQARYDLEIELTKRFGAARTTMLVSVLAGQKAIGVFSEVANKAVALMAEKLGVAPHIVTLPIATSGLVHDEVIPKKEAAIATCDTDAKSLAALAGLRLAGARKVAIATPHMQHAAQGLPIDVVTVPNDREFEDRISRMTATFAASGNGLWHAAESIRYGVVPVAAIADDTIDLPDAFVAPAQLAHATVEDLPNIKGAAKADLSYARYAAALHELVKGAL